MLGDLLVPPRSASGNTRDDDRLAFPPDHVHRLGGMNHLDLLNHPRVYEQIRRCSSPAPRARARTLRIAVAGFPFPTAVEVLPAHLPLPAKIRTELLEPIEVDDDPDRVDEEAYVQKIDDQVQRAIQAGMDRLAAKRTLPILG